MYKTRFKNWDIRKNNPGKLVHISDLQRRSKPGIHLKTSPKTPRALGLPTDFEIPERLLYNVSLYLTGPYDWQSIFGKKSFQLQQLADITPVSNLSNFVFSALGISACSNTLRASRAWASC